MPILSNQVHCNKCGDTIYSANRHDFKYCSCGSVAVDGGMDYLRRVHEDDADFEDQSIYVSYKLYNDLKATLEWCEETGRNHRGVICAFARVLREHGFELDEFHKE